MSGRGSRRWAARLLCAAAFDALAVGVAFAQGAPVQAPDAAELDPSAPLDPLPELGVDWPDLNATDQSVAPAPGAQSGSPEIGRAHV